MLDIKQLWDVQVPRSIRVSPSGRHAIYCTVLKHAHKTGEHAVSTIWLADVEGEKSARQLTSGSFNDRQPEWSPDSESIAFISDRAKPGKTCAIYRLFLKGGEPYPLTPAEHKSTIERFAWSPDGKSIAYLSPDEKTPERKAKDEAKDDADVFGEDWRFNRLRLLHVSTKHASTLVSRESHVTSLGWKEDGSAIVFTTQQTTELESGTFGGTALERVSLADKQIVTICAAKRHIVGGMAGLCWLRDRIYFIAGADPDEPMTSDTVYSVSVSENNAKWRREASGQDDCAADLVTASETVLVHVLAGLNDEIRNLNGDVLFSDMTSLAGWHAVSPHGDGSVILCLIKSTPSHPNDVFSLVGDSRTPLQLSNHGHAFTESLGTPTALSVPTADGTTTIDGLFISPASRQSDTKANKAPYPTVVLVHGGPYFRVTASFDPGYCWGGVLLSAGYAVLYPNYRGSSARGDAYAAHARGGVGTVDYDDMITMTSHCIAQQLVDPARLVIGGWSQGGFMSYLAAVRNGAPRPPPSVSSSAAPPDHDHNPHAVHFGDRGPAVHFRAAICGAGVTDEDAMSISSDLPGFESALAGAAPWTSDKDYVGSRRGSAIWEFAAAARQKRICPTLVLHGKEDERVPVSQAWAWHRGCRAWGVPVDMVTYPREGHLFSERAHLVDMLERVARFCDLHLAAP
ncbi:hypothetical protein MBLNU459_g8319t1 [Dothideomycetes sp. NU459]